MYKRRFNTKPLYVADQDEPEPEVKLEPISETGPASPSSCEDTKIEEPSPKKRYQPFFFPLNFLHFYGFCSNIIDMVNNFSISNLNKMIFYFLFGL